MSKKPRFPSHIKMTQAGYVAGAHRAVGDRVPVTEKGEPITVGDKSVETITPATAAKYINAGHALADGPMQNKPAPAPADPAADPAPAGRAGRAPK